MSQLLISAAVIILLVAMAVFMRTRQALLCAVEHMQDEHKQMRIQLDRQQQHLNASTHPTPAESTQMTKNLAYATDCYHESVCAYEQITRRPWHAWVAQVCKADLTRPS